MTPESLEKFLNKLNDIVIVVILITYPIFIALMTYSIFKHGWGTIK